MSNSSPWSLHIDEVINLYNTNIETGLDDIEVNKRHTLYGINKLQPPEKVNILIN